MFDIALSTLVPIFVLIMLGWSLKGWHLLPDGFFEGLNSLVFYIGLPAFLFLRISSSALSGGPAIRILCIMLAATFFIAAAAYITARLMKLEGPGMGAFIQASLRGNLAYIGLPVIFFLISSGGDSGSERIETAALLALALIVPIYNILCVIILSHTSRGKSKFHSSLKKAALNPLVISCILGIIASLAGLKLPKIAVRTLEPLAGISLPLALLSIGSSFSIRTVYRRSAPVLTASVLKVFIAPAVGFLLASLNSLPSPETKIVMIYLACPSSVSSYVVAEQMGADKDIAGGAVIASTLLSFIPLALIIAFLA
jgi:malate permease and related proteins